MCLILDTSIIRKVLLLTDDPNFKFVRASLFATHGLQAFAVSGGELKREQEKIAVLRPVYRTLIRAGRLRFVPDFLVDAEEQRLEAANMCKSDDPHTIALARVSGVRLLCTNDRELSEDFVDENLIADTPGKVYKNATHRHLLTEFCKSG